MILKELHFALRIIAPTYRNFISQTQLLNYDHAWLKLFTSHRGEELYQSANHGRVDNLNGWENF